MEEEVLNLFNEVDMIPAKTNKKRPAPLSTPPKPHDVSELLEKYQHISSKIGAKKRDSLGEDQLLVAEGSLRSNIYYKFWAAVAGMLDAPLNRVFFLLDGIHYDIIQSGYGKFVKRLEDIRKERVNIAANLEERSERIRRLIPSVDSVLRTTRAVAAYSEAMEEAERIISSYTIEHRKQVFLDAYESFSLPIPVFDARDTSVNERLFDTAHVLAVETDDTNMIERLNNLVIDDSNFLRVLRYIGWNLLANFEFFWGTSTTSNVYNNAFWMLDAFPNVQGFDRLPVATPEARREIIEIIREKKGSMTSTTSRIVRMAVRYIKSHQDVFSGVFSFDEQPQGDASPSTDTSVSLTDEEVKYVLTDDEDVITGLREWLSRMNNQNAITTSGASERFEEITTLVSDLASDVLLEDTLVSESENIRKKLEVQVLVDEELVVGNEFMTAFNQAMDLIRTTVPAFKTWVNSQIPSRWLMLDRRIFQAVARLTGLYYLQHIRLYQPKSWAPVRTNTDIGKDIMGILRQISASLGRSRFSLRK
jgi:hypothetical protein